jgi:hypothetical protein
MTAAESCLAGAAVQATYRALFCTLHRSAAPVASLGQIPHWLGPARAALGRASDLERCRALVPSGCFYALSTPAPSDIEVESALAEARDADAHAVLVPVIRAGDDTAALAARAFRAIPWFLEASYDVSAGVETDLRVQLGGRKWRDLRKVARNYERDFALEVHAGPAIAESVREEFDRLHRLNLAKYGHAMNFYDREVVGCLLGSPLGAQVRVVVSRRRSDGCAAQALLALAGADEMHLLVQGIDPAIVPPGQNLYRALVFLLFLAGAEAGVRRFHLGRGSEGLKLSLGANRFHRLDNHLWIDARAPAEWAAELDALAGAMSARAATAITALRALAQRGGSLSLPT